MIFPNTVPPFFPSFVLFAQPPNEDDYAHRRAGVQAHNRWLADFVAEAPERRAGIGQIFTNVVEDAIEDARWIKEHDLRGGVLLPNIAPDVKWVKPLYDPCYDPLWAALEELELPLNVHGGTGLPNYGRYEVSQLLYISEVTFYAQRPLVQLLLSRCVRTLPRPQVRDDRDGLLMAAWLARSARRLHVKVNDSGAIGELRFPESVRLPMLPSEYFARNCWLGVSQPGSADAALRSQVSDGHFMWGSDYPHDEGTYPYTREHLRQRFADANEDELRAIVGGNAAALYGFDLDVLAPFAADHGPTVRELAEPLTELPANPNEALLRP